MAVHVEKPAYPQIILVQLKDEFSASDVKGPPGVPVALAIRTALDATESDLYAISGLPPEVKLSAGGHHNQLWIVKQKDIQSLRVITPNGFTSTFRVSVTRAQAPNHPEQTRAFTVSIVDDRIKTGATADLVVKVRPEMRKEVPARPQTPEEQMLFERANAQLKKGDVAGARAIFEYLVTKGSAPAAFALGESYDPSILNKLLTNGVMPDEEKAREWYGKAAKLGNPQAQARLEGLGRR